jgi:molybdopterin converting factor subunit 1
MRVHLLYFGILKDVFGATSQNVDLPEQATVAALLNLLQKSSSNETTPWRSLAVAVNREYQGLDTMLHDGDEVALLPPVSGGAPCA